MYSIDAAEAPAVDDVTHRRICARELGHQPGKGEARIVERIGISAGPFLGGGNLSLVAAGVGIAALIVQQMGPAVRQAELQAAGRAEKRCVVFRPLYMDAPCSSRGCAYSRSGGRADPSER